VPSASSPPPKRVGLQVSREELNIAWDCRSFHVFDELTKRQLGRGREKEAAEMRDKGYDAFRRVLEGAYEKSGVRQVPAQSRISDGSRSAGSSARSTPFL